MKLNWKKLGKALWAAINPMLLGAIGNGNANRQTNPVTTQKSPQY